MQNIKLRNFQINDKLFLFIICILLIIILYVHYNKSNLTYTPSNNTKDIECVIARYNENTDWFADDPFNKFNMICYNKGPKLPDNCFTKNCKIFNLDNVGRCDHTYLYHIIKNYNNLADVTIFLPGSCMDPHKKKFTMNVINNVLKTKTTVLQGDILNDVRKDLYNFTLDSYKATNKENVEINPESQLEKSPIRPFGKWFDVNFGSDLKVKVFCFYGIIAVAREHIIQHPIERYQKLIKYVNKSSNPEAGHYMERSWGAIFYPYPESCVYNIRAI